MAIGQNRFQNNGGGLAMLQFEYLYALALLLFIPLIIRIYRQHQRFAQTARGEFAANLNESWLEGFVKGRSYIKTTLFTLAFALLVIALANPRSGLRTQSVKRQGIDVLIAMDVSRSMRAQDLKPSRMERAKQLAYKLLAEFRGDRVGIIFFAGKAFLQMPLTTDYSAAELFIRTASPDWEIQQGTAMEEAIDLAVQISEGQERKRQRALVFITDGENHEERAVQAAQEAKDKGIFTSILTVGTAEGAPIPNPDNGGNVTDQAGNTVVSKLNQSLMQRVADAGGGVLLDATASNSAIQQLRKQTAKINSEVFEQQQFDVFETYFQWFVGLALLLLFMDQLIRYRK
jgi:Ca-activated chloride channel family protein